MTPGDPGAPRRHLLEAAVVDTEGTIRATDTKASIALILHGLLFTGMVTVTKDLGARYTTAGDLQKGFVAASLMLAGLAFVSSVVYLLRCVAPAPAHVIPDTQGRTRGVFFVTARSTGRFSWAMPSAAELEARLHGMTMQQIEQEWIGEVLKLAAIRERKTRLIKTGLALLGFEVLAGSAYLALVAASAA